jgi:hypothetical protein
MSAMETARCATWNRSTALDAKAFPQLVQPVQQPDLVASSAKRIGAACGKVMVRSSTSIVIVSVVRPAA